MAVSKLGRLLIEAGLITRFQLNKALEEQKKTGEKLGTLLVKMGFISEEKLNEFLSQQYKIPSVNLSDIDIDIEAAKMIPMQMAQNYKAIPFKREGKTLHVAMANPLDMITIDELKFSTQMDVKPYIATEGSILATIDRVYENEILDDIDIDDEYDDDDDIDLEIIKESEEDEGNISDLALQLGKGPAVEFVNRMLKQAVEMRASDLHIEPYEKRSRVRFRIDGMLREVMAPKKELHKSIVARIKVMAKMKIQESRRPQDARMKLKIKGKPIDLRISTVPTMYGEKVAIRILDQSRVSFDFKELGMEEEQYKEFMRAVKNPYGIVLVTGPTGSGKTTTLYAAVSAINSEEINITTAEDPIEFSLPGINQLQVNESIGLTFAAALRAYLRQDPNVIMVGEIRDQETAEIAIRAALTGHLVLSTVHTNSAAATVTRLVNMGVENFLLASTVNLVESQRLIRKLCDNCKVPYTPSQEELIRAGISPDDIEGHQIYKARPGGCEKCGGTGYYGMVGIFEVMPVTPTIRKMILDNASTDEIQHQAEKEGMLTLRKAAINKLKEGVTDIIEVVRETSIR